MYLYTNFGSKTILCHKSPTCAVMSLSEGFKAKIHVYMMKLVQGA